mgnify:CR=1 FL=1
MKYHNGPVKKTEENAPPTTPIINVRANSLIEVTPRINNNNTITKVVNVVLIVRTNVCEILVFTTSFI